MLQTTCTTFAAVQEVCASEQKRLPTKLALEWRQGVEATKCKIIPVPARACTHLRSLLNAEDASGGGGEATEHEVALPSESQVSGLPAWADLPQRGASCGPPAGALNTVKHVLREFDTLATATEAVVAAVGVQVWFRASFFLWVAPSTSL